MKFKFDSKLQYQLDAIESTVNLFKGQKRTTTESGLVSKEQIVSIISEYFHVIDSLDYQEFEEGDSIFIVAGKVA